MLKLICCCTIILLMAGCAQDTPERTDGYSETPQNEEDSLFKEVLHGHDVAMAKMGKLAGYRKKVEQKIDSVKKLPPAVKISLESGFQQLGNELKKAEDDMNTWMHEFSIDTLADDKPKRINYLKSEKVKVNMVKDDMLRTLGRADSLLSK